MGEQTLDSNITRSKIYVIIPTLGWWDYTIDMLQSIKINNDKYDIQPIIIDNENTFQDNKTFVSLIFPNVIVIPGCKENYYTKSVNLGLEKIKELVGDSRDENIYILITNNDIILFPGAMDGLVKELEDSKVGLVSAHEVFNKNWHEVVQSDSWPEKICLPDPLTRENFIKSVFWIPSSISGGRFVCNGRETVERQWVATYCSMFKFSTYLVVGNLDEEMRISCSDVDYCNRIWKLGMKVIYSGKSFVFHYQGQTSNMNAEHAPDIDHMAIGEQDRKVYALKWDPNKSQIAKNKLTDFLDRARTKLYVIVPTLGLWDYTRDMLRSLKLNNPGYRIQVIVIDNEGTFKDHKFDVLDFFPNALIIPGKIDNYYTKSINLGLNAAIKIPKRKFEKSYILLASTDLIFTPGSIDGLVTEIEKSPSIGIVAPCTSDYLEECTGFNCDGVPYPACISYSTRDDLIAMSLPSKKIMETIPSWKTEPITREFSWIGFFCVLLRFEDYLQVGDLDDSMRLACSDREYCDRICKFGKTIVRTKNSFVFHYESRTVKSLDRHDEVLKIDEQDKKVYQEIITRKNMSKSVVFYSGVAWEKWSPENIDTGIGGSELCQIYLARELVKLGWDVTSYSDCPEEKMYAGVKYVPHQKFLTRIRKDGVVINSRQPWDELYWNQIKEFRPEGQILWCHDDYYRGVKNETFTSFDKIVLLSPWQQSLWKQMNGDKDVLGKTVIIPNGVNAKLYNDIYDEETLIGLAVPHKFPSFVWTSSYQRGLDVLIDILSSLRGEYPTINLHIYYGTKVLEKMGIQNQQWYIDLKKKIAENSQWIFEHGRVGQQDIALAHYRSHIWCYPTNWQETFCISALEAMAGNNRVICSDLAALQTTVGEHGIRIPVMDYGYEFKEAVKKEIVDVIEDWNHIDHYQQAVIKEAKAYAETFDWPMITKKYWDPLLTSLINK